jgi:signal transduction histidine kinase
MKSRSLASNIKRQAFVWTGAGLVLTLTIGGILSLELLLRDLERKTEMEAESIISMDRTDLLSGTDVRALELRLKKQLGIQEGENLLFLDAQHKPWVGDLRLTSLASCASRTPCRNVATRKVIFEAPIFFDEERKSSWGFLHIERNASTNWALVLSVALAVVSGALFQGLGIYFGMLRSVGRVSGVLSSWAERLSKNPKDDGHYHAAPFSEIEPIAAALSGLKGEIDALEKAARDQGALTTLRGVGHDILNPVARMKRIVGTMEMEGGANTELLASLRANIKRLSGYAEQLKLIYKRQTGESQELVPVLDVSHEVRALAKEFLSDPEVAEKSLTLDVEVIDGCQARIPAAAFGRIIENLCINSIQASNQGATVTLKVSSREGRVSICVADSGIGIPEQFQRKIFEPDFSTKPNKGTGLGLFVVKQVCEQYGGQISFFSRPGATTFTLMFPSAEVNHAV